MKNGILLILLAVMSVLSVGLIGCGGEEIREYSLTISSTAGGSVITPGEGVFVCDEGMVIELVAEADEGYRFVSWSGLAGTVANVNDAITTIAMNDYYSITANFVVAYELTISGTEGGSVTSPGEGTFTYDEGTVVNLEAVPDACYQFVNWTGDVSTIADTNAATTTITMNGNYVITADCEGEAVAFPDPNLEAAIRDAIGKPAGLIYPSDLDGLTSLDGAAKDIVDLTGLECATGLTSLYLDDNQISDVSQLANLSNLALLSLYDNQISDISPLANLTELWGLAISGHQIGDISPLANLTDLTDLRLPETQISDVSPLANLTSLTWLGLRDNQIGDVSPLANLANLTDLHLAENQISDISPLANLTSLTLVQLNHNQIGDISALVQNQGLDTGDDVSLFDNPLSSDSVNTYIPQLEARGVIVSY